MLSLYCIFLWLVLRVGVKGASDLSGCPSTENTWRYRARSGEKFLLFCDVPKPGLCKKRNVSMRQMCGGTLCQRVQWYKQPQNGSQPYAIQNDHPHITWENNLLQFSPIGINDAGSYICAIKYKPKAIKESRKSKEVTCFLNITVEVQPKEKTPCMDSVKNELYLLIGSTDSVPCPGVNCEGDLQRQDVTWYKNGMLCPYWKNTHIVFDEIYHQDHGVYVCDYNQSINSTWWLVRAVVEVKTVVKNTSLAPIIVNPTNDPVTLEVELGMPLTLECKVHFGQERNFNPVVKWYVEDAELNREELRQANISIDNQVERQTIYYTACLKQVTKKDLQKTFICFAQNSVGNATWTIKLKQKRRDGKEFDAFVSYAKQDSFDSLDPSSLNEESFALDLLPKVLEKKYGYTLCLFERDVIPGGVYTEDIVKIIKQSRRVICVLSPSYVSSPTVFELQAAVNLALEDQTLKLILIKFSPFKEPDSLPHRVKKALNVLPTITWRSSKSTPSNSRFWNCVRYHMPVKNHQGLGEKGCKIFPRIFSLRKKEENYSL
ncbi:interleukin-18 receptor accessory protein-like isoform X2 [Vombatus ursinus]|uniref:interleukin-18 receptor accessory protein-like isoform X2 n=1 Tax=Vombatus ursinus TaxID=29139 RepID=UPI000FFDA8FB|nr:interleukin-18 receptor accessory protein-like isoform X2 [Vombatus ursinus]XP_027722356.1 interleukin-18 receptor accessory protein-like isoform X2 [Vombatus ursinus]